MADENRDEKARQGREIKAAEITVTAIMASYEGRRWMADLLERSNMYADVYRFDGDSLGMAFRDGQANTGRYLLGQIDEFAPNEYQRLIRERRERIKRMMEAAEKARKAETDQPEPRAVLDDWADQQAAFYDAAKLKEPKAE